MFMSTVVYFVEFLLVSLVGILLYKLYTSYSRWKNSSAFASEPTNQVRITVSIAEKQQTPSVVDNIVVSKISVAESARVPVSTSAKKSSAILNDYIGEFFSQTEALDIDAFRASQQISASETSHTVETSSANEQASLAPLSESDDEVISIENSQARGELLTTSTLSDLDEVSIPTLKEFSDSDTFITVSSPENDVESKHNVMSDKVVLAMLDEAKLVCAS